MDGNKDAALKCLRIGKEALDAGDEARATRFLTKAKRLDPSLPVDDLLSSIGNYGGGGGGGGECKDHHPPEPQEKRSNSPHLTRRASSSAAKGKDVPESSDSSEAYTEEQVSIVRKIKKEKDYYQILGLERSCTVEDVRKAYRKLSLKVHPDKNKAPGAEEAFKAVSKAFQCLSNEETKKRYDVVGSDEPEYVSRRAARHDGYGYNGFYETEIDPDEIFRNFFFGGMAPTTTNFGQFRFRTGGMGGARTHREMHGSSGSNLRMLLQVLPVIVLILVNFIPSTDPPYALSRSYDYEHRLETPRGVPFFVKQRKFEQNYPRNSVERLRLEKRIEREYVSIVSQNCRVEIQRQQWGFGNKTPHCDMLQKYEAALASEA